MKWTLILVFPKRSKLRCLYSHERVLLENLKHEKKSTPERAIERKQYGGTDGGTDGGSFSALFGLQSYTCARVCFHRNNAETTVVSIIIPQTRLINTISTFSKMLTTQEQQGNQDS